MNRTLFAFICHFFPLKIVFSLCDEYNFIM